MGFHISQSITDAATILTIISFFMTLWVIRTTNFLKKKFKNKGRLPEIKTEITQTTNKIFSILTSRELDNNWVEFNRMFSMEVKTCYPVIDNLLSKVESDQKNAVKNILDLIAPKTRFFGRRKVITISNKDKAWDIYQELSSLTVHIDQIMKDMRWD